MLADPLATHLIAFISSSRASEQDLSGRAPLLNPLPRSKYLTSTWLGVPQAPQVQTLSELAPPLGGALAVAKQYQVMALKALVQKLEELE